jgi:hypothetical protein
MKSCSCQGKDKKCPYCEGSGQALWSLDVRAKEKPSVTLLIAGLCPICGTSTRKLGHHLRTVHIGAVSSLPKSGVKAIAFPSVKKQAKNALDKSAASLVRKQELRGIRANKKSRKSRGIPSQARDTYSALTAKSIWKGWTREVSGGLPDTKRRKH